MRAVAEASFAHQVLLEGVAKQVREVALTGHCVAVDGGDARVHGRLERLALQRGGVVHGQPRLRRMPAQAIAHSRLIPVVLHLRPEHEQLVAVHLAAHRPEPPRQRAFADARLERRGRGAGAPMQQGEASAVLDHGRVVGKAGRAKRGGRARVVDERVLEQPQEPPIGQAVHVLVVGPHDRPDPLGKERIQPAGRGIASAADLGRNVAGRRRVRDRIPRARHGGRTGNHRLRHGAVQYRRVERRRSGAGRVARVGDRCCCTIRRSGTGGRCRREGGRGGRVGIDDGGLRRLRRRAGREHRWQLVAGLRLGIDAARRAADRRRISRAQPVSAFGARAPSLCQHEQGRDQCGHHRNVQPGARLFGNGRDNSGLER